MQSIEDAKRKDIVMTAIAALGTPYKWGGQRPGGFDCSGLVFYSYVKNGVDAGDMPRVTTELAKESRAIQRSQMKPGDLVFFNTRGSRYSHVGLYLGDGKFINAPAKGKRVRIDSLSSPYYQKRFTGARRLHVMDDIAVAQAPQVPVSSIGRS